MAQEAEGFEEQKRSYQATQWGPEAAGAAVLPMAIGPAQRGREAVLALES